jgi:DEAD/DEAH box helicase domain-containing protein
LGHNLPILDAIIKDTDTRALYLFPTKALAQDQLAELYATIEALGEDIATFTYDGDTPQDARKAIRSKAHIVVTNPDMLHKGILPHHTKWVKLFENLKYVVIDELHMNRGVYGSHVGNVLRRLRRLCRFYGSDPQFLCSSATIKNPAELATALTGKPVEWIQEGGAPRGDRYFAIYNPPVVNRQLGIRNSAREFDWRRFETMPRQRVNEISLRLPSSRPSAGPRQASREAGRGGVPIPSRTHRTRTACAGARAAECLSARG